MDQLITLAEVRAARGLPPVDVPARTVAVGDRVRFIGTKHVGTAESVVWMPERQDFAVDVVVDGIRVGTAASRLALEPALARPAVIADRAAR